MSLSVVSSPCQSSYSSFFTEGMRAISHRGSSHRRTQSSPISPSPNIAGHFSHPYSSSPKQHRRDSVLPVYDVLTYMLEDDDRASGSVGARRDGSYDYSNSRTLVMSWASEASSASVSIDSNMPNQPHQYDVDAGESMASCRLSTARSMIKRAAFSPAEFGMKIARRASVLVAGPPAHEEVVKAGKGLRPSPLRMELEFARPKSGANGELDDDCSSESDDDQLRSDPFGSSPHSKSFFIDSPSSTTSGPTPTPSVVNPRRRTSSTASGASKRRPGPTSFLSFSSPTSSSSSLVSPRTPQSGTSLVVPRYTCRHPAAKTSSEFLATPPCCTRRLSFAPAKRSRSEPESLRSATRSNSPTSLGFDPSRVRSLDPAFPGSDYSAGRRRPPPSQEVFLDVAVLARTRSHSPSSVGVISTRVTSRDRRLSTALLDGEPDLDWRQFHEEMLEDESVLYLE